MSSAYRYDMFEGCSGAFHIRARLSGSFFVPSIFPALKQGVSAVIVVYRRWHYR